VRTFPRPRLHKLRAARRRWPLSLAGAGVVIVLAGVFGLRWLVADLPAPGQLIARAAPDTTKIYDRRGRRLFEVLDPRAGRRTRLPMAELPPRLRQAVLAIEDAGFYRNVGVDARGILRAAWQLVREGAADGGGEGDGGEGDGGEGDWWGDDWWSYWVNSQLRDEKAAVFADHLDPGTYQYHYLLRAGVAGEFNVIPALAEAMYFPEIFGRSAGGVITVAPAP
jgi:hypothetical protein